MVLLGILVIIFLVQQDLQVVEVVVEVQRQFLPMLLQLLHLVLVRQVRMFLATHMMVKYGLHQKMALPHLINLFPPLRGMDKYGSLAPR